MKPLLIIDSRPARLAGVLHQQVFTIDESGNKETVTYLKKSKRQSYSFCEEYALSVLDRFTPVSFYGSPYLDIKNQAEHYDASKKWVDENPTVNEKVKLMREEH